MNVTESTLPGLLIIKPCVYEDARGFFQEVWQQKAYAGYGVTGPFVQDNISRSAKNVLRGLHYQLRRPQGKLAHVTCGEVFDVAVDIRCGSPTFGRWAGTVLSDKNHLQVYIPPGFAHGFCVLSETAGFQYKCTDYYHPEDDRGIAWNDPGINIEWPLSTPILSEKDSTLQCLSSIAECDLPAYRP